MTVVAQVAEAGEVFSSGAIRAELAQGDVKGAAQMLGWWWRVSGKVTGGAKRGTGLGFPTANIALAPGTALAHGIYAVRVHLDGSRHDAAAYLGTRPTFDDGAPVLEVFLLDFDGDLYGRDIEVEFIDFIRGDRRFDGSEALQAQMARDCERAREILRQAPAEPAISGKRRDTAAPAGSVPRSRAPARFRRGDPRADNDRRLSYSRLRKNSADRQRCGTPVAPGADAARSVAMQRYPAKPIARIIDPVA